ncbi:FAD-dependent oxidoreductase [Caballeronia sp. LP006]|uniref:NAD(P)/FAD-dependent oxidoreductase n=1 Tax=Caballeronia sp. LP006 TaxID=3038552 RepID=UPI002861B841|nr:FAD-dependent oxidoreductase [Caballeronia sp. LP006]MDR5832207.1 FAD-dependent oxidoreductase [Caballeronia sp. LP006]
MLPNEDSVLGQSRAGRLLVVGGGLVGLATAHALLRDGLAVTLIDPGIANARCSFGNAGSISAGSVAPLGMPGVFQQVPGWLLDRQSPLHVTTRYWPRVMPWLLRFVLASRQERVERISRALKPLLEDSIPLYKRLLGDIGALDLITETGQLQLYPSEAYRNKDAGAWTLRRDCGVALDYVGRREIDDLEPAVGPRYTCGVFLPNEGLVVNPARLVDVLTTSFAAAGGTLIHARAKSFLLDAGVVRGVETDAGRVTGRAVVIAAGAWSRELSRQLGDDLPLQTQRGYHLTFPAPHVNIGRVVVAVDRKCFISPLETGLRIAGTVEFDSLAAAPNYDRTDALVRTIEDLLPGVNTSDATAWMGNRPCFPDSMPVIDRARRHYNVFYAFGNGHLGLTGAPKTGQLVADMIAGREPSIDIRPFSASRF